MYSIVHSMGIIWGIKGYIWLFQSDIIIIIIIIPEDDPDRSIVPELWKIVCKNNVFISVHLLVPMCEENTQYKIFYKNTNESATILTYSDASKKQGRVFKTNVVLIINDTGTPCLLHMYLTPDRFAWTVNGAASMSILICLAWGFRRFSLTLRSLTLYIYGAPILDVSRSHTTTQRSR